MVTLDADWAAERGLDPRRTSRMGFACKSCGETFPAVTYRHQAPVGIVCNVLERDAVWAHATTWFAMIEGPANPPMNDRLAQGAF